MGSGFKDWTAGDVLTAADVDGYLMRQAAMTFADSSARDTALTGVLDEGMVAYLEDVNWLTVYDGSAWVVVSSPWTSYTPTLTNGSNGNGTLSFAYRYTGWKTIRIRGQWTLGSTSSISGALDFSEPSGLTIATTPVSVGVAVLRDADSTDSVGAAVTAGNGVQPWSAAAVPVNTTVPFTWATGDIINVDIECEIS